MSLLLLASRLWQAFLLLLASFKFLVPGAGSTIADVPGVINDVVGVSVIPFEHAVAKGPAVAGGPAVTGFPAVDLVLAVASIPAYPGVPILAGDFTY